MYKLPLSIVILLTTISLASCNQVDLAIGDGPYFPGDLLIIRAQKAQEVYLNRPHGFNSENSYSLLVVLHGNGGTAQGLAASFATYNDQPIFVVVPQGQYPKPVGGAIGYSWYYETSDKSLWEIVDPLSSDNIVDVIKNISAKFKVKNIFVFGFSQGASLAYTVGLKNPKLIKGVAAVGGILPEIDVKGSIISSTEINNAKSLKVFVARGTDDTSVGKNHFDNQKSFFQINGFETRCYEYSGGHYLTTNLLNELFKWINSYE